MTDIDSLTLREIREISSLVGGQQKASDKFLDTLVGKNVIYRTVTMIYTGRLEYYTDTQIILVDCAWIPETERFADFVATGAVRECEPYPDNLPVGIGRGGHMDICELKKQLPRSQK